MSNNKVMLDKIEKAVSSGVSYIEALAEYAEENNIDIESIASIVQRNPHLKNKIQRESEDLKLIKNENDTFTKTSRLPF